ncbi:MAG TPA: ABC transporter ATP-binding protein [Candidatus Mailhella merdavium]|nr:ABC transporter ATP-binding protein [Candidatus Mailhella merdavium]
MTDASLELRELCKRFLLGGGLFSPKKELHAVNNVSLLLPPGQTLGLVGESGCGKSTLGNMILGLLEPDEGDILYGESPIRTLREEGRAPRIQAVFQDPFSSLDPRMTVEKIVTSPLLLDRTLTRAQREDRARGILAEVGLGEGHLSRYPHEFSGGQRQRIGIARALAPQPDIIVMDEPTSALDVSVQAQILDLIRELQARHGYAYLFISHDLAVVRHVSHQVAVMYLGFVVEHASCADLFRRPLHPYTRALMACAPEPDPTRRKRLDVLEGDVPSPVHLPAGCPFAPRCAEAEARCAAERPALKEVGPGHTVRCHKQGSSLFQEARTEAVAG